MMAPAITTSKPTFFSNWYDGFLEMVPAITKYARRAFRYLKAEARAEALQEVLVSALLAYSRLHDQDKIDRARAGALARYAVSRFHEGRRVGEKMNCHDVLSPYARRKNGIQVESLQVYDREEKGGTEMLVEDRHAGPADTAAARVDVAEWLALMKRRDRRIANALSAGSTTGEVARRFGVSAARVSQKRREFLDSWQSFHGEQDVCAGVRRCPCCR